MDKKSLKSAEVFASEEENILVWANVQTSFEKNFGTEVYSSWLKNISLLKEYNDYLVLGVPTRFFRDWIVSRYLDKILAQLKTFKNSINRVEFKISEDHKINSIDNFKILCEIFFKLKSLRVYSKGSFNNSFSFNNLVCSN